MDLPLPWFCSSFWKVKICKKSDYFLIGKSASMAVIIIKAGRALSRSMVVWVLSWEVGCNGRRMALKLVGADNFGIHGN